jgi:hypothetical protein
MVGNKSIIIASTNPLSGLIERVSSMIYFGSDDDASSLNN